MTAREVAAMIESWAPLSIQESWDNAGFCVGSPDTKVKGVLLCLDVTAVILQEALDLGANMIISHHPLIFQGLKQLCEQNEVARIVTAAIKSNLVIYSAHTNADKVTTGVSGMMAGMLDLQEMDALSPDGFGMVGNLPVPQEVSPFLMQVKRIFHTPCLRFSQISLSMIQRVAVCGGSGAALIPQAMERGADIFISGEFGYHHFFSTNGSMMIADIGHYESEISITQRFAHLLSEKNVNFAVHITKNSTNSIHYF